MSTYHINISNTYNHEGLQELDSNFLEQLKLDDGKLHDSLISIRAQLQREEQLANKAESAFLIELAPHVENFIAHQFALIDEIAKRKAEAEVWSSFFVNIKRKFVQRRGLKQYSATAVAEMNGSTLISWADTAIGIIEDIEELDDVETFEKNFAKKVSNWLLDEACDDETLKAAAVATLAEAERYSAWAATSVIGKKRHQLGLLFRKAAAINIAELVPIKTINVSSGKVYEGAGHKRHRDGFHLTEKVKATNFSIDQAHYCIWCHVQGRDTCSQGIKDKKTGDIKSSPHGAKLAGCPLSEKISEMHLLKADGFTITPVAVAMVDNPMMAGTGHRICNDCMKACIYQKQEPVDIPQSETRNLEDVLSLPYGFEIYALLARWNPLNLRRPFTLKNTGKKVLIVGLGPAGYTLAHHLLQDGHTVVAIDGLKIEPLPASLSGRSIRGDFCEFEAIESVETLMEDLDNRILAGFGGVSEYGITVRWNKNYLKLLRIMLERAPNFRLFGGVRFGNDSGTITINDAIALGFDHIALCMGAGKPTVVDMENAFAPGVRQASDFLMGLQLTGAAKLNSLANLQIRMPIVVVGGGLTAIDTATESLAYYVRQVERYAKRHHELTQSMATAEVIAKLNAGEQDIHETFLSHGNAIIAERKNAETKKLVANFTKLTQKWGGATVVYRKAFEVAPAFVLNHEEITKAMEEGIYFAEHYSPTKVDIDELGYAKALQTKHQDGSLRTFPARSILIAAGTQPNTVLAREVSTPIGAEEFAIDIDGKYFSAIDITGKTIKPEYGKAKPDSADILMHRFDDGRMMSFFGDLHPSFFGNVVKAMASAKQGYPLVTRALKTLTKAANNATPQKFFDELNEALLAKVVRVFRLTNNIVEVVVHAPMAAKNFHPGQFYRLQNFESTAASVISAAGETKLAMEGLALTGAWVDVKKGDIGMIVMEMGGSANLCTQLSTDEPVVLMGPTGTPTEISANETVLLAGGGLGNAVLFSIGSAFRARGSKVLYFAGYRGNNDRYHIAEIEAAADTIVWCCDVAPGFSPSPLRPQDKAFVGNIVEAMQAYANNELGKTVIAISEVERIIAIGSDKMMAAVAAARHTVLKNHLTKGHTAIGSINSPMQCMMKEICSQCIQQHKDPITGKITTVFSCFNQDQDLDKVDFAMLANRLRQNSVVEKQTAIWIQDKLQMFEH